MRKVVCLASVFLALGGVTSGCGGDSGAEEPTVAKAVCARQIRSMMAELKDAYERARSSGTSAEEDANEFEVTVLTPILVKGVETQIEDLRAIGLPEGDEDQITAMLESYEAWSEEAKATPLKVVSANNVYNEGREMAGEYGLVECEKSLFEA